LRILPREHLGDDLAGTNARIALEHDKAPRHELAVIGHPRPNGENGLELSR
jgi:hypothetical protein